MVIYFHVSLLMVCPNQCSLNLLLYFQISLTLPEPLENDKYIHFICHYIYLWDTLHLISWLDYPFVGTVYTFCIHLLHICLVMWVTFSQSMDYILFSAYFLRAINYICIHCWNILLQSMPALCFYNSFDSFPPRWHHIFPLLSEPCSLHYRFLISLSILFLLPFCASQEFRCASPFRIALVVPFSKAPSALDCIRHAPPLLFTFVLMRTTSLTTITAQQRYCIVSQNIQSSYSSEASVAEFEEKTNFCCLLCGLLGTLFVCHSQIKHLWPVSWFVLRLGTLRLNSSSVSVFQFILWLHLTDFSAAS